MLKLSISVIIDASSLKTREPGATLAAYTRKQTALVTLNS